jgi:photosystem II stability/assembly factor-like uncharacterized protein
MVLVDVTRRRTSSALRPHLRRRAAAAIVTAALAGCASPAGAVEEWQPVRLPAAPAPLTAISAGGPGAPNLLAAMAGRHDLLRIAGGARWHRHRLPWDDRVVSSDDGIRSVALDPVRGRTGYAATSQGVYVTRDGGRTWRRGSRGLPDHDSDLPGADPVGAVAVQPGDPRRALVGTLEGMHRTVDGGRSWRPARTGLPTSRGPLGRRFDAVVAIVLDPRRPRVAYAVTQGVSLVTSRTRDGGRTWTRMRADVDVVAVDPADSAILYGLGRGDDLVRSDDEGRTWHRVRRGAPVSVALDPVRAGRLVVSERGGVVESADRGRTWSRLPALPTRYHPGDLRLAVDRRSTVYASSELGAFRLAAGRGRWVALRRGALAAQRARLVLADPRRPRAMYAVVAPDRGPDRIASSSDGGSSWRLLDEGLGARSVRALTRARRPGAPLIADTARGVFALSRPGGRWARVAPSAPDADPRFSSSVGAGVRAVPRTASGLVVAAEGHLAVSRNRGRTWSRRVIPGFSAETGAFAHLEVLDDSTGTVLAAWREHGALRCGGIDHLAVGRSVGRSWFVSAIPLANVDALAVDPRDARHVLAAGTAGRTLGPPCVSDPRIAESRDGGATWSWVPSPRLGDLAFDPVVPERVHALGEGTPLRSDDGGRSWSALPALPGPARATSLVAGSAPVVVMREDGALWRLSGTA